MTVNQLIFILLFINIANNAVTQSITNQSLSIGGGLPHHYDAQSDVIIQLPHDAIVRYHRPSNYKKSAKILFWSTAYGHKNLWKLWFDKSHMTETCPEINCKFTVDKSQINSSDVIVFMMYRRCMVWNGSDSNFNSQFPPHRRADQRWVYYSSEPPDIRQVDQSAFNGLFNWTMTYRKDSDIIAHFGRISFRELATPEEREASWKRNYASGKNKTVAWFVGHCQTDGRREDYVGQLKKYIDVDVYGLCGTLECKRHTSSKCEELLSKQYKFYLSFENTICKDYATEKLIRALAADVVPVVFGGADYTKLAPIGSYINALDFPSPIELAQFLNYLHQNDNEYNKYFDWKRGYGPGVIQRHQHLACELCLKAMDPKMPKKTYMDLNKWWNDDANCRPWKPKI